MVIPSLVVHGGAWIIDDSEKEAHMKGMKDALEHGYLLLKKGGSATDAVEEAINIMEDSGVFDAGKGCVLNERGFVELDAMIMSGDLKAGAVAAIKGYVNPISVARTIMDKTPHIMLVGEGAESFARNQGFKQTDAIEFITEKELKLWRNPPENPFGTVGAVALDKDGKMCAGTSTGGTRKKMYGRVGDSPLIGCGGYCDNESGGASSTGHGESFMRIVACKTACDFLKTEKSAQDAAEKTMDLISKRAKGKGGIILMRKDGDIGVAFNTPQMARGYIKNGRPEVFV